MPTSERILFILEVLVVAAPTVLVLLLGITTLLDSRLSEQATAGATRLAVGAGLLACCGVLGVMIATGTRHSVLDLGNWIELPGETGRRLHFAVKFEFDRLSVPLAMLSFVLCGVISSFAAKYMHREAGYNRFFTLFAVFLTGMIAASLADTIETLFTGWELVGLSSVLLIAFFQERPAPCRNGFRVWVVYRISDAALLLAAVVLHHMTGEGDFDKLLGTAAWPYGEAAVEPNEALAVGSLLLLAAAGKSALVPFSGWLPRAMEGPTPSSAVFYGALSVHLGAFLLLRLSPLIALSPSLAIAIIALGFVTAVYAYLVGSVQTDVKSVLSFASLAQVGMIVMEIGLGHWAPFLWYVALVHLLGHAFLRTLQFVRASTFLQDVRALENAMGERLPRPPGLLRFAQPDTRAWLYRFALERGYLDAILIDFIVRPFLRFFQWCDRLELRFIDRADRATSPNDESSGREVGQHA
ncbi:MAG TPA: proton-conducting transporter membrane subunit [Urbifossiella sp.]|nr:proton-conducting transporter membrane subunit [Urbifossiella sp.]